MVQAPRGVQASRGPAGASYRLSVTELQVVDLGRMGYADAYAEQQRRHAEVLAWRGEAEAGASRPAGIVLLVEHDPVITVTRRPGAAGHVLATPGLLARHGVELVETDRGGDVTYHGPGQLVAYPIVDLNRVGLRLHEYMRALEGAVIAAVAGFGVAGERDPAATGVWVPGAVRGESAKLCAMGVRVRRWVSMHGLALNVTTDLSHFGLIVPCGLAGRPVTSLHALLGDRCPPMAEVKAAVVRELGAQLAGSEAPGPARAGPGA